MKFEWADGGGGGALDVVIDAQGKAFGWLCDASEGSDCGGVVIRRERYKWWIDRGPSGEADDYHEARRALGRAAAALADRSAGSGASADTFGEALRTAHGIVARLIESYFEVGQPGTDGAEKGASDADIARLRKALAKLQAQHRWASRHARTR